MSLFAELKRRNVLRVGVAYVVGAWLVIQVVETIFPAFGFSDALIRGVVIVLSIGLVPALILTWVYEITPTGLKLDSEVDHSQSIAPHSGKKLDRMIIVFLTIAVGYFAVDKFLFSPIVDPGANDYSIAVLSFNSNSTDADDEFLAEGISEDILHQLTLVPRLRVISGSSSFALRDENLETTGIGELLDAELLIDGSVRRYGDDLRVTAELIDTRSNSMLWSRNYDRKFAEIFDLQTEIATAIVAELRRELGMDIGDAPDLSAIIDPEAHAAYQRGRKLVRERSDDSIERSIEEFEGATEIEPKYALAHAEAAIALFLSTSSSEERDKVRGRITDHLVRAVESNPDLAETQAALAFHRSGEEALYHLRRAIEINPNYSDAWYWLSDFLGYSISIEERFEAIEKAVRLDPLSPPANWDYFFDLIARNRIEDAERQVEKFESIDATGASILRGVLDSLGGKSAVRFLAFLEAAHFGTGRLIFGGAPCGRWAWEFESLGMSQEILVHLHGGSSRAAEVYFGDTDKGLAEARAGLAQYPNSEFDAMKLGEFLAHAGNYDEARPYLERAWQRGMSSRIYEQHDLNNALFAESYIAVMRASGDDDAAEEVLQAWQESVRRHREAGITATYCGPYSVDYQEGVAAYLSGDKERALLLIGQAIEDGFPIPPTSAYKQERYRDPDFAGLLARQGDIQERERQKVLEVVCVDNPYADTWQPLEETCADYVESVRASD